MSLSVCSSNTFDPETFYSQQWLLFQSGQIKFYNYRFKSLLQRGLLCLSCISITFSAFFKLKLEK